MVPIIYVCFQPSPLRALQQRQTFAPVYIEPFTASTSRHSFYDAVFCASKNNISELQTVFNSVSAALNGVIPCKSDLAKIYDTISGVDILVHGYSTFALPTWINVPSPEDLSDQDKIKRSKIEGDDDRAKTLKFLQEFKPSIHKDDFVYPVCSDTPDHSVKMTEDLVLITKAQKPKNDVPPVSSLVLYNSELHFMPKVRVLNYGGSSSVDAFMATLCGLVIETFEIDSSIVPQPNDLLHIGVENSQFLSSSIPYSHARYGLHFDTSISHIAFGRQKYTQENPTFASLLGSSHQVIIPRMTQKHIDTFVGGQLPGLTFLNDVSWMQAIRRFFGGQTTLSSSPRARRNESLPSGIKPHSLLVWSPYSFTSPAVEIEDIETKEDARSAETRTFFLTNFRTLFGVDITMTEVSHFLEAMPVV